MPMIAYVFDRSPPCRAVMLIIKALGLDAEFKNVDLVAGEQKTEAFKKINPAGKVPVLDDNGLHISESYAINAYLVTQYGKDDTLYPKDAEKRAMVDTMLYFDASSLDNNIREYFGPQILLGKPADPDREAIIREKLTVLNTILDQRTFAAGDHITIADFSIVCSLSTLLATKFNLDAYPNITKYVDRALINIPFYDEITKKGMDSVRRLVHERLGI